MLFTCMQLKGNMRGIVSQCQGPIHILWFTKDTLTFVPGLKMNMIEIQEDLKGKHSF